MWLCIPLLIAIAVLVPDARQPLQLWLWAQFCILQL
jgi:hypothetical protein